LLLALSWLSPGPPGSAAEQIFMAGVTPDFPGFSQPSADRPLTPRCSVDQPAKPDAQTPAIALGQPGFSLRYVRTFGQSETPYFDDPNHLHYPTGVGTDGNNLWIAEISGRRALKYKNDGTFVMQVGKAGFVNSAGTSLVQLVDVAVDSNGNTWIVDSGHHVIKFDPTGIRLMELGSTWNSGTANDRFNEPYGIAFDSAGNVYISDKNNHRIQVFNGAGTYLTTLGATANPGSDNAHFRYPRHIAIDPNNRLYVADTDNHRVQIFDVANVGAITYLATLGVTGASGSDNGHFNAPQGVAVDMTQGRIHVADGYNYRVQVFGYATRAYQQTLTEGSFIGDVAVDAAGYLYVAKSWSEHGVVRQFDSNLNFVRNYGTQGVPYLTDGYHYEWPGAVAVAPDGSIYIGEREGKRLVKLNAAGVLQWSRGVPGVWGTDNNHFTEVNDVALDSAGRAYAVDSSAHRVQMFEADGAYFATLGGAWGTGDTQFNIPRGIAIGPDDRIYVADTFNHHIQIFDQYRHYLSTIGQTGVAGSDNAHFNQPEDVEVDASGNIYVADENNHRIQVFDSNRVYVRTIGVTGISGDDYGHLQNPKAVVVDRSGRTYVADQWGNRLQVFNSNGAYLTTVGGSWGSQSSQVRNIEGLALDAAGNLYMAEFENARIQKFAPGVPGWRQVNINGFGDWQNSSLALDVFNGQLYAGVSNTSKGAQMWRSPDGRTWTPVSTLGFGMGSAVPRVLDTIVFGGKLYVGTGWDSGGARIWRTSDGATLELVADGGFGDLKNDGIGGFVVFKDTLYAIVSTWSGTKGFEIWRSSTGNSGDWTHVVSDGFGSVDRNGVASGRVVFDGYLYGGFYDHKNGATILRTDDGTNWSQVNTTGFGDPKNTELTTGAVLNGRLYFGTRNDTTGAQLWRSTNGTTWESILINGFGNPQNIKIEALVAWLDALYAVTYNTVTGTEVWRSSDGANWVQLSQGGFGDSNNGGPLWSDGHAVFNNTLYIGTWNNANGGELWQYLSNRTYLPLIVR
jgi:sugar lactone lactonase YvrE